MKLPMRSSAHAWLCPSTSLPLLPPGYASILWPNPCRCNRLCLQHTKLQSSGPNLGQPRLRNAPTHCWLLGFGVVPLLRRATVFVHTWKREAKLSKSRSRLRTPSCFKVARPQAEECILIYCQWQTGLFGLFVSKPSPADETPTSRNILEHETLSSYQKLHWVLESTEYQGLKPSVEVKTCSVQPFPGDTTLGEEAAASRRNLGFRPTPRLRSVRTSTAYPKAPYTAFKLLCMSPLSYAT